MGGVQASTTRGIHPTVEVLPPPASWPSRPTSGRSRSRRHDRPDQVWYRLREEVRRRSTRPASNCRARAPATYRRSSQWSDSTFANLPFGQGESMTDPATRVDLPEPSRTTGCACRRASCRIGVGRPDGTVEDDGKQPKGIRVVRPVHVATTAAHDARVGDDGRRHRGQGGASRATPWSPARPVPPSSPIRRSGGRVLELHELGHVRRHGARPTTPQFVVAIMIDNPAHGVEGGDVAAPLFKRDRQRTRWQHADVAPTGYDLEVHVRLQDLRRVRTRSSLPLDVCHA